MAFSGPFFANLVSEASMHLRHDNEGQTKLKVSIDVIIFIAAAATMTITGVPLYIRVLVTFTCNV